MSFSRVRLMCSLFALLSLLMLTTLTHARDYVVPDEPLNVMYNGQLQYGYVQFSTDGRYAVIASRQSSLVFFHDLLTNFTELVSVDNQGQPLLTEDVHPYISVSDDGRYVAFERAFIVEDNWARRIYIRDRVQQTTTEITQNDQGQPYDAQFWYPQMTPSGRYVVFYGGGAEMPDGSGALCSEYYANGYCGAVFVYDQWTNRKTRVSLNSEGARANGNSAFATISDNGRYVAFLSDSTNLGGPNESCGDPGDEIGLYPCWYLYLHDRQLGTTRHIAGVDGNTLIHILVPTTLWGFNLSGNGRYLVYSYDLDWEYESPIPYQVFVYDTLLDTTDTLVLKDSGNNPVETSTLGVTAVSDDGRFVVLQSQEQPEFGIGDVRVYDRVTDTVVPLVDTIGNPISQEVSFDAPSPPPLATSGDGNLIGFWSESSQIILAHGQTFPPAPYTEVELVKNGGAETQGVMTKMAEGWQVTDYRAGRRRCDHFPNTDNCVFQIKPVKNKIARFTQSVPAVNNPGDTLDFSAFVRGFNVSRATLRVQVNYADGTTETMKIPAAELNGTYDYKQVTASMTLDKLAYSIKVQMYIHFRGTGKLLVDDVSLMMGSGEAEALDLIPVPDAPTFDLPGRTTN